MNPLGVTDTGLANVVSNDMTLQGLVNLWKEGEEGGYLVRRGRQPVNDFPNEEGQNIWEKGFPMLFPYGRGGMERKHVVSISLADQTKWALAYHDRHFQKHPSFSFFVFGVQQRREALLSARIRMRKADFEREARIYSMITASDLKKAAAEEERGEPVTDEHVKRLKRTVTSAASRIMGSDQSRWKLRSKIRATTMHFNPPNLWITINPDDLNDPVVQVLAGEEINLDAFSRTAGPSRDARVRNIAQNGMAGARFFQYIIMATLEILFGIKVSNSRIYRRKGIFGYSNAYFGTVESQDRGTLHLHLLLWLKNSPMATRMKEKLLCEGFRQRMIEFIKANIRAHHNRLPNEQSLQDVAADS